MNKIDGEVNNVTLPNNATVSVDSEDYRMSAESKGSVTPSIPTPNDPEGSHFEKP